MNWYGELDYFYPLDPEQEQLFASPRETVLAIQSYNRILYSIMEGDRESVLEPLELICKDFPIFAEARHLLAILMASRGEFERALKLLKQTALLELEADKLERVKFQLKELEREVKKSRLQIARQKQREEALIGVKADLAKASILQRAGEISEDRSFATSKERKELVEREESGLGKLIGLYAEEEAEERQKTIRFTIIVSLVAVLILSIFFAFVRPAIMNKRENTASERLRWLEKEIAERQEQSAIADLLKDYEQFLAGENEASTDEKPAE
ncbi:MAG: hypothetical protein Q4P65_04110 [Eubacteriales bacterium]|nr:hypothetical protein [Eubacteriales bacterium]